MSYQFEHSWQHERERLAGIEGELDSCSIACLTAIGVGPGAQVNRLLADDPQRVLGIAVIENPVPLPFEGAPNEGADVLFIVHDENRRHERPSLRRAVF